jgi:cob(I)alamin adenosyltransferase
MTMSPLSKGFVQIYTGDGKGKTTAALGQALRAAGSGLKSFIVQFMKNCPYGEIYSFS